MKNETGVEAVIKFLQHGDDAKSIDQEANLFETGMLDSLQFMSFIYLLEEHSSVGIELENLEITHFETLRAIKENFFGYA